MNLSRRELLTASAILLAGPHAALRAAAAGTSASTDRPIVLCWNENPYGPSPAARAAVSEAIATSCRYPDDEMDSLVGTLAAREGVSADCIVTGTGSGELLRALGMLAARSGGEIVAAQPGYGELPHYAEHCGATLKFVPVDAQLRRMGERCVLGRFRWRRAGGSEAERKGEPPDGGEGPHAIQGGAGGVVMCMRYARPPTVAPMRRVCNRSSHYNSRP